MAGNRADGRERATDLISSHARGPRRRAHLELSPTELSVVSRLSIGEEGLCLGILFI